jgi:hypothetical protein
MPDPDDPMIEAIHEAGHAVVAKLLALSLAMLKFAKRSLPVEILSSLCGWNNSIS